MGRPKLDPFTALVFHLPTLASIGREMRAGVTGWCLGSRRWTTAGRRRLEAGVAGASAVKRHQNRTPCVCRCCRGKGKRRRWSVEGEVMVVTSGLRRLATVCRLLGKTGDNEEEAQGVGHGKGKTDALFQEEGPFNKGFWGFY